VAVLPGASCTPAPHLAHRWRRALITPLVVGEGAAWAAHPATLLRIPAAPQACMGQEEVTERKAAGELTSYQDGSFALSESYCCCGLLPIHATLAPKLAHPAHSVHLHCPGTPSPPGPAQAHGRGHRPASAHHIGPLITERACGIPAARAIHRCRAAGRVHAATGRHWLASAQPQAVGAAWPAVEPAREMRSIPVACRRRYV